MSLRHFQSYLQAQSMTLRQWSPGSRHTGSFGTLVLESLPSGHISLALDTQPLCTVAFCLDPSDQPQRGTLPSASVLCQNICMVQSPPAWLGALLGMGKF